MQPGGALPIGLGLPFRVEMGIKAVGLVKEFLVGEQRYIGPNIIEAERFTPARVAANQIGIKTRGLQFSGCPGAGLSAQHLAF